MRLFSTEQITKYHPDKMADQVSDAIVTILLKKDPNAKVAIECLLKAGVCVLAGEIKTTAEYTISELKDEAQRILAKLDPDVVRLSKTGGYEIITYISEQSPEINKAVDQGEIIGAGDQGIMFGYATSETRTGLPYALQLANTLVARIERATQDPLYLYTLKGDAKVQVTVDLDKPQDESSVHSILISVCHNPNVTLERIQNFVREEIAPEFKDKLLINPAGTWSLGGPWADAGLTGRKIVCDQYGGFTPVGGGAFSGKDPSKVDRSATYMARYLAQYYVDKYQLQDCSVQLAYAIGVAEPVSVNISTTAKHTLEKNNKQTIEYITNDLERFDLTPRGIIEFLDLQTRNYAKIAAGCHFRNFNFTEVEGPEDGEGWE